MSKTCLVLLTIFVTVLIINSPGAGDVGNWITWAFDLTKTLLRIGSASQLIALNNNWIGRLSGLTRCDHGGLRRFHGEMALSRATADGGFSVFAVIVDLTFIVAELALNDAVTMTASTGVS
jgi:hypothetical protein